MVLQGFGGICVMVDVRRVVESSGFVEASTQD
jgi:hypothetical protein